MLLYIDANYASPYALSCFVALREKNLAFETRMLDLDAGQHKAAGFARESITVRVPTLIDGDFALSESSAIDEYLEDAYPAPKHASIYPADVRARARARQIQAWVRSDLMPIREERSTATLFMGAGVKPLSDAARAAQSRLVAAAQTWLAAGQDNLFGQWCIADTDLAVMLARLVRNGDEMPQPLVDYVGRQWARPSVAEWVAHTKAGR
jgi:glutathione S-transferase